MKNFYKLILWWFAFPFIAILNGTLRELTYKKFVGDLPAHQISTVTGILSFGIIFYFILFLKDGKLIPQNTQFLLA